MKLNLGCGRRPLVGYLNIDMRGGDVLADIRHLPFKDCSFQEILASHILEHIPDLEGTIQELHRVLKPHALLKVVAPLGLKSLYIAAHLHAFNFKNTLQSFCYESTDECSSFQSGSLFRMVEKKITNWHLPFMWHVHKHITGRLPSLRITWRNHQGRVKTRLPLGPRFEATFWMEKRSQVEEAG